MSGISSNIPENKQNTQIGEKWLKQDLEKVDNIKDGWAWGLYHSLSFCVCLKISIIKTQQRIQSRKEPQGRINFMSMRRKLQGGRASSRSDIDIDIGVVFVFVFIIK